MAEHRGASERPTRLATAAGAACSTLALLIAGTLLAGCDHVGIPDIPERPYTAFAPEFKGMWDYPLRSSGLIEGLILRDGILRVEGSCVLVIEGGSSERIMLLLPRLDPIFRPSASRRADEEIRGTEYAIAWLPTMYDEDSQSLWVGTSERVRVGDHVVITGWSVDDHREECDADWSWRVDYIEQWP